MIKIKSVKGVKKRSKQKLNSKKSNAESVSFQDAINRGSIVSITDKDGIIIDVNSNFIKASGYSRKELIGSDHRLLNSGHHTKSFWKQMWNTINKGKTWQGEVKNKAKNGKYYWVDTLIIPVMSKRGVIHKFLSIRNDITARKKADDEFIQSSGKVSEALIFGKMGRAELDLDTRALLVTKELFLLLDIESDDEVIPLEVFLKTYISADFLPVIHKKIEEGMTTSGAGRADVTLEFQMITARGRKIWIDCKGIFKGSYAMGILQDVTDKKKSETEIVAKGKFISTMLQGITDGFFATDRSLNYTFVNPAFALMAGMKAEDMIGKNILALFPYMENSTLIRAYHECIETGRACVVEYRSKIQPDNVLEINIYPNPDGLFIYCKDISELRKDQEEIKKLALIARHTNNAVILTDVEGKITWVNDGFVRIMEYSREEIIGKKPAEIMYGVETNADTVHHLNKAIFYGEMFDGEILNYSKSGKRYWMDVEMMPVKNESNTLTGFIMVESDITNLKKAIKEMQQSEQALQTFMDHAPLKAFIKDLKGRYTFYNRAYEEFINRRQLRPGFTDFDLFDKSVAELHCERDQQVTRLGIALQVEHQTNEQTLLEYKFPVRDAFDRVTGVGGILLDITEKLETQKLIAENAERLQSITDNLSDGVIYQYIVNEHGRVESFPYVSNGALELFELSAEDMMKNASAFFRIIEPEDLNEIRRRSEVSRKELVPFEYEYRIATKSGTMKWVHTRSSPKHLSNGKTLWNGLAINVTARKKLELAVQASEIKLQGIFNTMISGVVVVDDQGKITYANQSAAKVLAVEPEGIQNALYFSNEWRPIDENGTALPFEKLPLSIALHSKKPVLNIEHGIISADWKLKWLTCSAAPLFDEDQKLVGAVANFLDITEPRKSENKLRESELRFRMLADSAPVLIWMSDRDKLCNYFNKGWLDFTGRTLEQEFGNGWAEGVHPEDLERCKFIYSTHFDQRKEFSMEYRLRRNDGQYRWIIDYGRPRYLSDGQFVGYIGSCFDIHDRKEAEKKLIESEQRFNTFMKHTPVSNWITDLNGNISYVNAAYYDMFDFSYVHAVGKNIQELFSPDISAKYLDDVQKVSAKGEVMQSIDLWPKSDKTMGEYLVYKFPMGNNLVGGVAVDITAQRNVDRELKKSLHEKDALIKEIHHRVKNNLQLISSILYIRMGHMKKSETKTFLEDIRQKIRSIALIHERLLQTGSVNEIDIAEYLGKLIIDLQMSNNKAETSVKIESEIESHMMTLDKAICCGLIINELVTNSIKHAFEDRASGIIKIILIKRETCFEMIVSDNGTSLPENISPGFSGSFGMQLLDIFIKQLNSKTLINRENGTEYLIQFN